MKLKNVWFRLCAIGLACLMVSVFLVPLSALANTDSVTDGSGEDTSSSTDVVTEDKIHAAYTFDQSSDLTAEVGGVYPLSTEEFGESLLQSAEGYHGGGVKGYFNLDGTLFCEKAQFTVGFWTRISLSEAENRSTVFLLNGSKKESAEVRYAVDKGVLVLKLEASDGKNQATCSYDLSQVLTEESSWVHLAFTYKKSGSASLLTLYVNGKTSGTSISAKYLDFSGMTCKNAAFHNVVLDDLYVTDTALDATTVSSMRNHSVKEIYRDEGKISGGENPDDPSGETTNPVDRHNYSWAAYLFEGTFAAGTDFHSGDIPAAVDRNGSLIDSEKLKEKYGYALIRRENTAPESYLTLDSRLFRGQSAFTFAAWVYRNGTAVDNQEYLLDLKGTGTLRFAPYAGESGKLSGYVEYTDLRGNLQRKTISSANLPSPKNKWVHYALSVSAAGELTVYVDGVAVGVFSTGITPATSDYTQCRVVSGASASDTTRTAVDEVYVTPKVLSAAEIRKIHFYGLSRYTSEVLPDPGNTGTGDVTTNPYAPDAVDMAEDSYHKTASIGGGFIGTTFDARDNLGKDWNGSAPAAITGGRLSQGISSYGLALDGASFLRYPARILDETNELTVSLSYSWEGPGADNRSQRIFDFSRKTSSVAEPAAYLFLETGNGFSGLRFGISDGVSSTYLPCDYNEVNTWTRVTVTIKDGTITLYVNDTVAATGDTAVDLSSICPNFCYVGRSGVKGDPMFVGSVDEIYISNQALASKDVAPFVQGISYAINGEKADSFDLWNLILVIIIVVGVVLVLGVVALIIVIIVKKDKKSPEEEAPVPVPVSSMEGPEATVIGPRTAARMAATVPEETGDATVKFRKVDSAESMGNDAELTTKFRRISDGDQD
ncbi:MAG: hypothetical protein II348_02890 [Clostridia bacterium]|nr:hypothetical protein [Clostridia bacterium]